MTSIGILLSDLTRIAECCESGLSEPHDAVHIRNAIEVLRTMPTHNHQTYSDADADRPDVICDSNGQVVLDLCKNCGKAEAELLDNPVCAKAPRTVFTGYMANRNYTYEIREAAADAGFNCNEAMTAFLNSLLTRVLPP